ncbi:MAG: class I SAM-dependent methyltransferase [Methanoculleus marisnigri]|nr:class I SAM-dependent methyltransferase [Methanoculleus marisnigri]
MKTRESGMPDEGMWRSFFDPEAILTALGLDETVLNAVDFGCGYGTFSLPAARRIHGTLHGFDIEAEMVAECERRAREAHIQNLSLQCRDFVADGTGLPADSVDYTMLFNILHAEQPLTLLHEAWRILKPGGRVSVIHWNHDPATPRGPSMDIRPRPEDCLRWVEEAGFVVEGGIIDLPPYHYGLLGRKKGKTL